MGGAGVSLTLLSAFGILFILLGCLVQPLYSFKAFVVSHFSLLCPVFSLAAGLLCHNAI